MTKWTFIPSIPMVSALVSSAASCGSTGDTTFQGPDASEADALGAYDAGLCPEAGPTCSQVEDCFAGAKCRHYSCAPCGCSYDVPYGTSTTCGAGMCQLVDDGGSTCLSSEYVRAECIGGFCIGFPADAGKD